MLLVQTCQMVALADLTDARGPNTFSRNGRNGFRSRRRLRSLAGRKSMTEAASSWQAAARRMRDRPYDLTRRLVVPLPLTAVGESRHRIPRCEGRTPPRPTRPEPRPCVRTDRGPPGGRAVPSNARSLCHWRLALGLGLPVGGSHPGTGLGTRPRTQQPTRSATPLAARS